MTDKFTNSKYLITFIANIRQLVAKFGYTIIKV